MKASLLLGLLLGVLAGCKHSDPDPAPAPSPTPTPSPVTITAHVTANCPGIAPYYRILAEVNHFSSGSFVSRYFQLSPSQDQIDETHTILVNPGSQYASDSLQASVALPGPYANFTIPRGGFAQVDILVNGKVRKSARVDTSTPLSSRNPYLSKVAYLRFKDL